MADVGHCKHGEFILSEGCEKCIAERRAAGIRPEQGEMEDGLNSEGLTLAEPDKQIVKVKYYSETTGELSSREYTYYSADRLSVGDIVIVPVRDTIGKAKVSAVDVPEAEIEAFKDKVKTIPGGSVVKVEGAYTRQSTGDAPPSVGSTTAQPIVQEVPTFVIDEVPKAGFDNQIALIKVKPNEDVQVQSFYNEALKAKEYAEARVITTVDDLKPATDDLSLIAKLKKAMESKRKEYVSPLQDHVKSVNDAFKTLMEPIETADTITREKILAFQLKQKLIREGQERINALRLEAAKKEMELKGELTEPVNLVEVMPEVAKRTITDMGSVGQVKIRKWEVEDLSKVPLDYLMIDAAKVGKVVRAGIPSISGIKIWQEDSLRITAKMA